MFVEKETEILWQKCSVFKFSLSCCSRSIFWPPRYLRCAICASILPYFASGQFRGVTRIEMITRKLYMLFHLYVVSSVVFMLHYNGMLRSPPASRFDQSLIKGNWKWYTFIEVRLKMNFRTLLI